VEWVETTGKTVEEAKDAALDQLGVDEHDAEFDILEEPRTGLFGRTRGEARVRARVRPTQPRPKVERRERRGRSGGRSGAGERTRGRDGGRGGKQSARAGAAADASATVADEASTGEPGPGAQPTADQPAAAGTPAPAGRQPGAGRGRSRGGRSRQGTGDRQAATARTDRDVDTDDDEEMIQMSETELAAQGEVVRGFLLDLLDAFGLDGEVTATPAEEGAIELDVTGGDLGLLIGPKGQTLQAVQELSRSILQRQLPGETHARIRIDVAGYRQRRREALERFVRQIAEDVRTSGLQKALEPMSPPDRKVVHDTVNEIEGVRTMSEGEDARRRVVILPDA